MAEQVTIARPYAEAVFRLAKQTKAFGAWSDMLQMAAAVAADERVAALIANPRFTAKQLEELVLSVCGKGLTDEGKNLVVLLAENGRLAVLPEIRDAFEQLRAAEEGVVEAKVATAFPLNDGQLKNLMGMLEAKFGRKIHADVVVDPELIGGVTVEVGDEVFDASVRGRLQALASTLKR